MFFVSFILLHNHNSFVYFDHSKNRLHGRMCVFYKTCASHGRRYIDVYIMGGGDGEAIAIVIRPRPRVRPRPCLRPIAPKNQTSYEVTRNEGERERCGGRRCGPTATTSYPATCLPNFFEYAHCPPGHKNKRPGIQVQLKDIL